MTRLMRLVVAVLVCLLFAGTAHAGPESAAARRKVAPPVDKLAAAAGEAFGKAEAADKRGDLGEALRFYRKALAISPHPSTQYNIADVQRRKKDFEGALKSYRKYLEMDPAAKDRREVEKLIAQLDAMPGKMIIEIEESSAKVFVQGKPIAVKPEPTKRGDLTYTLELPKGAYSVDVITAISHANDTCRVYRGSQRTCRIRLRPRVDGNLIISGPQAMYRASIGYNHVTTKLKQRFAVEPGRQELYVRRGSQCKPMIVRVAPSPAITYVWADVPEHWPSRREGCYDLTYKVRTIRF